MFRPFSAFVALRFMRSKSSNGFLSFITLISTIGLVLGVASLIVVTSVLNGFEQVLTTRILGMVPHASVTTSREGMEDWQYYAEKILKNDPNVEAVAPFIITRGISLIKGEQHGSIVNGIDVRYQGDVSVLPKVLVQGDMDSLQPGKFNIILGQSLVEERGIKLGDKVIIMLARPSRTNAGVEAKFHSFKLSGVYSVSNELDSWMSYINIDDAATILEGNHNPTGLRLKLKDIMDAKTSAYKATEIMNAENINNISSTWQKTHQNLYDSIRNQKNMMSLLLFLIIIVALFNIISALIMMTTEKESEIAILKTFGASKLTIAKIFLGQGIIIGTLGTSLGLAIGVFITLNISQMSAWLNNVFDLNLFDRYYVSSLPAQLNANELVLITVISLITCLLASVYPAIKASNKYPVEALKRE